jgi:hypothetical protein
MLSERPEIRGKLMPGPQADRVGVRKPGTLKAEIEPQILNALKSRQRAISRDREKYWRGRA